MFKIYLNDHCIAICDRTDSDDSQKERILLPDIAGQAKFLQKLQNTKTGLLVADDAEAVFREIVSWFPVVEAAGGLTTNPNGEILMIFRHNRWDLPKGKRERGESMRECAVREVAEECGIEPPQPGGRLTDTCHLYRLDDEWVLKRTAWYRMEYRGITAPLPQTEEHITAVGWIAPSKLDQYLSSTYPTIVDVFESAGYRIRPGFFPSGGIEPTESLDGE